jgi:hypothetical protein
MPHQVTVTGKSGPDRTITAAVLSNVSRVDFDLNDKILQVYQDGQTGGNVKEYDLTPTTVVTFSISAGNYSVTVS